MRMAFDQCVVAVSFPSVGCGVNYFISKVLYLRWNYFYIINTCKKWYMVYIILLYKITIYMHVCLIDR